VEEMSRQQDGQLEESEFSPLSQKEMMPFLRPERAKLIVLEGIDLSGRTTQVRLLQDWLVAQHYRVTTTAWRSSPLISDVLARARLKSPLQPLAYSLLYCADHLDRSQQVIKPALERGEIVLADRYAYTAFARDEARGLERAWVRNLYHFTLEPDIVFYLHISPEEAVQRRLILQRQSMQGSKSGKSGKDEKKAKEKQAQPGPAATTAKLPSLSGEALESFRNFEKEMYSQYQNMQKEFGFSVIEGSQSIDFVQAMLRRAVMRLLLEL
jgi:dTMP kinase